MNGIYLIFVTYANEHEGWFPDSKNGSMAALQLLHPDYCPAGRELAGISGDIEAVVETLKTGKPLNETLTSWRYVSGLRDDDDPKLAILWEAKSGLYANGRRNSQGSRAVLLISGDITNVVESGWAAFLKEQEARATVAKHKHKGAKK